jgi:hypothetical protein
MSPVSVSLRERCYSKTSRRSGARKLAAALLQIRAFVSRIDRASQNRAIFRCAREAGKMLATSITCREGAEDEAHFAPVGAFQAEWNG